MELTASKSPESPDTSGGEGRHADSTHTRPGAGGRGPGAEAAARSVAERDGNSWDGQTHLCFSLSPRKKTHNKHLKSKYKRVLSKTNTNRKASVLTKQENMDFQ